MSIPMPAMTGRRSRWRKSLILRVLTQRNSGENQVENAPSYYTTYYTICP